MMMKKMVLTKKLKREASQSKRPRNLNLRFALNMKKKSPIKILNILPTTMLISDSTKKDPHFPTE